MSKSIESYFSNLHRAIVDSECTRPSGEVLSKNEAFSGVSNLMRVATTGDNKLMFVGNGGSAGIASHMAIDYSKNGNMRALAFNDGAALTCLGNDLGYEQVFAKQIDLHARSGDLLIAISSSGQSRNILNAVTQAKHRGCDVVTFSGFTPANPLRSAGDFNFFINSGEYGFVEVGHLALIHAILDLTMNGDLDAIMSVK